MRELLRMLDDTLALANAPAGAEPNYFRGWNDAIKEAKHQARDSGLHDLFLDVLASLTLR